MLKHHHDDHTSGLPGKVTEMKSDPKVVDIKIFLLTESRE